MGGSNPAQNIPRSPHDGPQMDQKEQKTLGMPPSLAKGSRAKSLKKERKKPKKDQATIGWSYSMKLANSGKHAYRARPLPPNSSN